MTAATPLTIGAPALDVARLIERLPAELRARVMWTRKPIEDALDAVLLSPGDADVLEAASRAAFKPVAAIMEVVSERLASPEFAVHRAGLMSNLEVDQRELSAFVADPGVVDTLDWCVGFLKAFYRELWSHLLGGDWNASVFADATEVMDESLGATALRRGTFALMAASEVARRHASVEDAVTLINLAFLEFEDCRLALAHDGLVITPFADETREQRLRRISSYVTRIRETFTDRDFSQLDAARFTSLRE
jgi:hypothetical protein